MRWLLLLLLSGLIVACGLSVNGEQPPTAEASPQSAFITILEPTQGALLGSTQVTVRGTVQFEPVNAETITVQGVAIPVEPDGSWQGVVELSEGSHRITAEAGGEQSSADVMVDVSAPVIRIESPEPASYLSGPDVRLRGTVTDATSTSLVIEGEPVPLDEQGRFDVTIHVEPGAHRIRLLATDALGQSSSAFTSFLSGSFRSGQELVPEAIGVTIGSDSLAELSIAARDLLRDVDLTPVFSSANPVVDRWAVTIDITSVDYGELSLDLSVSDEQLIAELTLRDLDVGLFVDSALNGDGSLVAEELRLTASLGFDVVDGRPHVSVEEPGVIATGLDYDLPYVPQAIENLDEVHAYVRDGVENGLISMMDDALGGFVEEALESLSIRGEQEIFGIDVALQTRFRGLRMIRTGLVATMDLGVRPLAEDVEHEAPGTLLLGSTLVEHPTPELGLAVSPDLLNAVIATAWQAGVLDRRIGELAIEGQTLATSHLALLLPSLRGLAPDDAPTAIEISPALPMILRIGEGGRMVLEAPDVRVAVVAVADGVDVPLATVSVGLQAEVIVSAMEDQLSLGVKDLALEMDLVSGPSGMASGPALEQTFVPLLSSRLADLTTLGNFPLPRVKGFSLSMLHSQSENGLLYLFGQLEYASSPP